MDLTDTKELSNIKIAEMLTRRLQSYSIELKGDVETQFMIHPEYEGYVYRALYDKEGTGRMASIVLRRDKVSLKIHRMFCKQFIHSVLVDLYGPGYVYTKEERKLVEELRNANGRKN